MFFALLLAFAAASPSPSPAASPSPLPVITTVRVATGSPQSLHDLPVAAYSLGRTELTTASAATPDELFRELPGFDRSRSNSLFTNYGQLRVSFAGAGTDRGLVLADGLPAQDGFGGQVDWAAYPVSDLRGAELLLGAGSALYGAGAVGGVLDLLTYGSAQAARSIRGQASQSAGNRAYAEQWIRANGMLSKRWSASLSLEQQRLQYAALPPAYSSAIDRPSQAQAAMAALAVRYDFGERDMLRIEERGAWDDQFEGRPNYTFSRRWNQTAMWYAHSGPRTFVRAGLYARSAFVVNAADKFPAQPGVLRYVQDVPSSESGASLQWTLGGAAAAFDVRGEVRHVAGASGNASGLQDLAGLALQQTWRGKRFEAVAGARLDDIRSYGFAHASPAARAVSPRIAARFDPAPHLAIRVSSGSGLRAPYLNELVRGYAIGSVSYEPNARLVPERSGTVSAGMDWLWNGGHLSFDAFDTRVNDAIMFRTIDAAHQQRSNVARTRTQAYVLAYTQDVGRCAQLALSASAQNARVESGPAAIAGKRLQYVPANSASLAYIAPIGTLRASISISYLGQTYADDLNRQALGTALVAGARLHVPLAGGAALDLRADNLTDARYLSSIDRYGTPMLASLAVTLPIGQKREQRSVGLRCNS